MEEPEGFPRSPFYTGGGVVAVDSVCGNENNYTSTVKNWVEKFGVNHRVAVTTEVQSAV